MPRTAVNDNSRLALRIQPADKAIIMRAVAIEHTDMTAFILRSAAREAKKVIQRAERIQLGRRDSRLVLQLLETPPKPNARLRRAAKALPGPV